MCVLFRFPAVCPARPLSTTVRYEIERHTHRQISFQSQTTNGERERGLPCQLQQQDTVSACVDRIQVVYLRVVESILGCRVGVASSIATPSGTHER